MFERFVERRAKEALSDTPVVLIVGPRRAGKTTLVRKMGETGRTYITLDDQTVLEAAQSDPTGWQASVRSMSSFRFEVSGGLLRIRMVHKDRGPFSRLPWACCPVRSLSSLSDRPSITAPRWRASFLQPASALDRQSQSAVSDYWALACCTADWRCSAAMFTEF